MKMKLIVSLLVLCLAFSMGSALAKTDTSGSMDKSMAGSMGKAIVVMAGNVTGTVTCTVNEMNGMAGNMSVEGKTKTRNINGNMLVIKDIEKKTENIVMIGKMDGMAKPVTIIGKINRENKMAGENENTAGMTGSMDSMAGYKDNEKVIITGDITCDMAGKMVIIGKMSDMGEMTGENEGMTGMAGNESMTGMAGYKGMTGMAGNEGMTGMAGYKAGAVAMKKEDMTGIAGYKAGAMAYKSDDMAGSMNNEDNMAEDMDKNVAVNATIRYNMTGKMVIIGKMGDIKGMFGNEGMAGMAGYKAGAVGVSKEGMKGIAAGKAGAVGVSKEGMKGIAAGKAGVIGVSNENMTGIAAGKAGIIGVSNENMTGIAAGKAGALAFKNANITVLMAGIVKCKMTGINMVVIGKMEEEEMAGTQTGMTGEESGMMTGTKSGMTGEESGMMTGTKSGMMTGMENKAGQMKENMIASNTENKGC